MDGPDTSGENGTRETLRRTFDRVAALYDRARPDYPERLFDDLFLLGNLRPGARVLEIGCGTGQSSRPLARRGCGLVCVEIGENLAAIARRNLAGFPGMSVVTAEFETWDAHGEVFDMVFASAAWHWLDPATRFAKAAAVLKPQGRLAIVGSGHAFPNGFDPFFTEIQPAYEAIGKCLSPWPPPAPEDMPDEREAIEGSGLFGDVRVQRYLWTVDYTADGYIDLLDTYSDHRALDEPKRAVLYSEIRRQIDARPGGCIRKHYQAILHVARLIRPWL